MNGLLSGILFACQSSLWLLWGSLILAVFTPVSDLSLLLPAAALGGALAGALKERGLFRLVGVLPLTAALLLCRSRGDWLLTGPLLAYLLLSICRGTVLPDRDAVAYRFRREMLLAVFGSLFCILAGRPWAFRCGVISMSCLVYLMRLLRHSRIRLRTAAVELIPVAAVGSLCLLLSSRSALEAGAWILKKFYFWIVYPILILLGYLVFAVVWLISRLAMLFVGDVGGMEQMPAMQMQGLLEEAVAEDAGGGSANPLFLLLLRVFGILLFLLLAGLVFRYLRRGAGNWLPTAADRSSRLLPLEEAGRESAPGLLDRSPEARIRRSYAAYCRELIRLGLRLEPDDTTRSIESRVGESSEADSLRELYLRARYAPEAEPRLTAADAARAAELLRVLRSRK